MSSSNEVERFGKHAPRCMKIKNDGVQCLSPAVSGSQFCNKHGGNRTSLMELAGTDLPKPSPIIKRPSRYSIAGKLGTSYMAAIENKENILDGIDEIAILIARTQNILEDVENEGIITSALFTCFDNFLAARASGNVSKMSEMLSRLESAFIDAKQLHAARQELIPTLDQLRKNRESEQKRLIAMRQMLNADDARLFFQSVQDAVLEALVEISDEQERIAFQRHFARAIRSSFKMGKTNENPFDYASTNNSANQ